MKTMYWRPTRVSRIELLLIATVAVACLVTVEGWRIDRHEPYYNDKLRAANLAAKAFEVVRLERLRRGDVVDPEADPTGSGLIGVLMSPVTTNNGNLLAKQTSINPNFAAVLVHYLRKAGAQPGDVVAVGMSGSFPALNIATLAALEVLQLRPLIIVSAAASQWGANDPQFMWLDMQRLLQARQIISSAPLAATRGGIDDRGVGLQGGGQQLLDESIVRNGVTILDIKSYDDSVAKRMALFHEAAGGAPIRVYVNVGGGTTSVGTHVGKRTFKPGLNMRPPAGGAIIDSVMQRFANEGLPVIHMVEVTQIAHKFGLPLAPKQMPPVGQGKVFVAPAYSPFLAGAGLLLIVATMVAFLRMDIGVRLRGR